MRRPLANSITARTSVLFALLAAFVFLVMGAVIRTSVERHFAEQDTATLSGKLELIRHVLQASSGKDADSLIRAQLASALVGHHDLVVRVRTTAGREIFAAGHDALPDATLTLPGQSESVRPASIRDSRYRLMVADVTGLDGLPAWRVGIAVNIAHHQDFLSAFEHELVVIGAGGLLLMAVFGWVAVRRGLTPLQEMTAVAQRITAQRLHDRLMADTAPVELESLAHGFNAMLDRLSDSLERLSAFSSDLAHELRTPVNNLLTQTQVLLSRPRTEHDYREVLYSNLEEFERLARMISDMLFLAKADNGLVVPHREAVHLEDEVTAVLEFYEALATDKSLIFQASGKAMIMGDALMLRRVLSNLISNAVRHATAGTAIIVGIVQNEAGIEIAVENEGETIPEQHLPHLFERFYRADSARQRSDEGVGLGLAITRSIVTAHRGMVTATSTHGKTRFTATLPQSEQARNR